MKLHTLNGTKMILQVDKEISFTEDVAMGTYGLLQVDKDVTTGTVDVVLAQGTATRTFDLEKIDVNSLNLLVSEVKSTGSVASDSIRVFQ